MEIQSGVQAGGGGGGGGMGAGGHEHVAALWRPGKGGMFGTICGCRSSFFPENLI